MNATLRSLEVKFAEAVHDLDSAKTQARLPRRWSIQQIMEHLILSYSATEAILTSRIGKGRPTQARPSLAQSCGRIYVIRLGFFPRGVSAPVEVTPPNDSPPLPGEHLASMASEHLVRMDALLDRTSKLFGDRKKSVSHLVLGPLSPPQWRKFHLVHGLHHIKQIQAIRKRSGPGVADGGDDAIPQGHSADPLRR